MATLIPHRYFDLSASTLREVQVNEYVQRLDGRYATAKITIEGGEDGKITIIRPADHWLHSPKLLREMEELLLRDHPPASRPISPGPSHAKSTRRMGRRGIGQSL